MHWRLWNPVSVTLDILEASFTDIMNPMSVLLQALLRELALILDVRDRTSKNGDEFYCSFSQMVNHANIFMNISTDW